MNELEHWRFQSDMIVSEEIESQAQSEVARSQMFELVLQVVVSLVQCQVGVASV